MNFTFLPIGDPRTIAKALHSKYRPETYSSFFAKLDADKPKHSVKSKKHHSVENIIQEAKWLKFMTINGQT